jgi:hypothetical protein
MSSIVYDQFTPPLIKPKAKSIRTNTVLLVIVILIVFVILIMLIIFSAQQGNSPTTTVTTTRTLGARNSNSSKTSFPFQNALISSQGKFINLLVGNGRIVYENVPSVQYRLDSHGTLYVKKISDAREYQVYSTSVHGNADGTFTLETPFGNVPIFILKSRIEN